MKRGRFRFCRAFLATIVFGCGANGANAESFPGLLRMNGKCRELIIGNEVLTSRCKAVILNSAYDDGRVGFYFFYDSDSVVTLSGMDLPNPGPDTDEFAIDRVIRGSAAEAARNVAATGKCTFGNPYKRAAKVYCSGHTDDGMNFSAAFITDGAAPQPVR